MFENILGNEKNKKILEKAINLKKMSHSYIFWGTEGIGKKIIAKEFAKQILCLGDNKPDCKCKSCIEFDSENNPDFQLINSENDKIKIEQIREMQRKIAEKPIISHHKVYIIDNADKMTPEAQNCLLKTLEEPPEYIVIILICSNENNLLSTIKSRCTRLHFDKIENSEILDYINKNEPDKNISPNIIEFAQGSIGKALKLSENIEIYENVEKLIEQMKSKDLIDIMKSAEQLYKSKEEIDFILEFINVILLKFGKQEHKYVKCLDIVENTKKRIKANSNYDMCIDNLIFNMWEIINQKVI